jgi:5,10-methenyltetrahydrofolate synthetase
MLKISEIRIPVSIEKEISQRHGKTSPAGAQLEKKIRKILRFGGEEKLSITILRHAVDCRKKPVLFHVYTASVTLSPTEEKKILAKHIPNVSRFEPEKYVFPVSGDKALPGGNRPAVIGAGPAGLFAAYMLALHGYRPILLERGRSMEQRTKDVEKFWKTGSLDETSNIQFGEGGAGTFSDGKLNTLVNDKAGRNAEVLRIFTSCGAPEEILTEGMPHIGTDRLREVIVRMRGEIIRLGGDVRFEHKVTGLLTENGKLAGLKVLVGTGDDAEEKIIHTGIAVLAPGHRARDTFRELFNENVPMEQKNFAVGFRVLHPQLLIDENQYGVHSEEERKALGLTPSPYKLTAKAKDGRGVYSFCMCPGGYVVNASSEKEKLAVNGMSYYDRGSAHANSAIVMTVSKDDFGSDHPLAGMEFQEKLEQKCYELGDGKIPVESFADFDKKSENPADVPEDLSIRGAYTAARLHTLLSPVLSADFAEGMHAFGRRIQGFDGPDAYVAGLESRTSSPVRIPRNEDFESVGVAGLYPCGEGAGYAGGIMSAAMDGIRAAEAVAAKYRPFEGEVGSDLAKTETKDEIRRRMRAFRDALPEEERKKKSLEIQRKVEAGDLYRSARCILIYVSVGSEADTRGIIEDALLNGKKVYCPSCEKLKKSKDPFTGGIVRDGGVMDFYRIRSMQDLSESNFGIPEPKKISQNLYRGAEPALMIMPGIAFDIKRNRVGYKGGYYDRYLNEHGHFGLHTLAIAFDAQVVPSIPASGRDVKPSVIVTESRII